ncbi:hypothetical protein M2324_000849 [Rhodovulum sulfidophilum]|nr:hypothetical protein [Rhodovulum sulfidophilum]
MSNAQRRGPGKWARSGPPVSRPRTRAVAGRPVSRRKAGRAFDRVMRRPCGSGQASGSSVGPQASAVRHGGPVAAPGGDGPAAARLAAADPARPWSRPATVSRSGASPHRAFPGRRIRKAFGAECPRLVPVPTRSTVSTPCRRRSGRPASSGSSTNAIRSAAVTRYNDHGHDPTPRTPSCLGRSRPPDCRRVPSLLQPRAQAHDPQRARAMRIYLQDPGVRADRRHPRPDPADAGLSR